MSTTRTIARAAVASTIIGVAALTTIGTANAIPRESWGEAQEIVDAFPQLLPSSPSDTGYHEASCTAELEPFEESGADVALNCVDSDEVYMDIYAYKKATDIPDVLATIDLGAPETGTLADGSEYTTYQLEDNSTDGAVVFITFEARDLSKYMMVVSKEGATFDEIAEIWGADAPIGSVDA